MRAPLSTRPRVARAGRRRAARIDVVADDRSLDTRLDTSDASESGLLLGGEGSGAVAFHRTTAMRDERRPRSCSEPDGGADRDHGRAAGVDGVDDFGVVDALEVDRGDAEVAVANLALDHDERHALVCHLHRMRLAKLMGARSAAECRLPRRSGAGRRVRPRPTMTGRAWGR
jgi:hypothetical protein